MKTSSASVTAAGPAAQLHKYVIIHLANTTVCDTAQRTLHSAPYIGMHTLRDAHCTAHTVHRTLGCTHCTMHTVQYTLCTTHWDAHTAQCTSLDTMTFAGEDTMVAERR